MNATAFALTRGSKEFSLAPFVTSAASTSSRNGTCRTSLGTSIGRATFFLDFDALATSKDVVLELSDSDARTTESSLSLRRFAKALTLETYDVSEKS